MSSIIQIKPLGFPWQTQDPFLFCAYHNDKYPKGNSAMGPDSHELKGRNIGQDFQGKDGWSMYHGSVIPGFPFHPHRGFETITINENGVVDHSDSLGAAGRFMKGDVQWMTAGRGVQHSEMFPLVHEDKDNHLEIFQVWLNLPRASKMVEAHFKMLWREDIPIINHKDSKGKTTRVQVIAGKIDNSSAVDTTPDSWAANPNNAVGVYTVKMEPDAEWTLPATLAEANRSLFFYRGANVKIESQNISVDSIIEAKAGEKITIKNGPKDAAFLILEGKPIGEPVVQHGPFVMNTVEEIQQTMREYGRTQFGGWPWGEREMAHPRGKGRFALHADGKEEVK